MFGHTTVTTRDAPSLRNAASVSKSISKHSDWTGSIVNKTAVNKSKVPLKF